MRKQIRVACHGEVRIVKLEDGEKVTGEKLKLKEDMILADSETTGNHHMLRYVEGVHVWDDKKADKYFIKTEVDTKVYCKLDNRHTDYELLSGNTYAVYKTREVDHITKTLRNVRD